jgi:hypothetical protein
LGKKKIEILWNQPRKKFRKFEYLRIAPENKNWRKVV